MLARGMIIEVVATEETWARHSVGGAVKKLDFVV